MLLIPAQLNPLSFNGTQGQIMQHFSQLLLILCIGGFGVACQTTPELPTTSERSDYSFPTEAYRADARRDAKLFQIDAEASTIHILVYRAGLLADRGHNHVVVPGELQGALWLPEDDIGSAELDIAIPLDGLQMDPAQARETVGGSFGGTIPADDREGARDNMLGPDGLNAAEYPVLGLRVREVAGELPAPVLQVQVFLHGYRHDITVPVTVSREDGQLRAEGSFALRQTWFGLEPFSALAGTLRVQDWLTVTFDVVARPAS